MTEIRVDEDFMREINITQEGESPDSNKSITDFLGIVKFKLWGIKRNLFFKIDLSKGVLLCFKNKNKVKPTLRMNLIEAKILNSDVLQKKGNKTKIEIIVKRKKGKVFTIIPLEGVDMEYLNQCLDICYKSSKKSRSKAFLALLGKGAFKLLKMPVTISVGIVVSLEKISSTAKKPFGKNHSPKTDIPNPAKGIISGTSSMITNILSAASGIITEPVKGAKKSGIKGATSGLGKGLCGLIIRPVAGSIDLVTMTARGMGNMAGTVYHNAFKVRRKKYADNDQANLFQFYNIRNEDANLEKIAEDDEQIIYLDRKNIQMPINEVISNNGHDENNIDALLGFYSNTERRRMSVSSFENEEMCEFLVVEPQKEKSRNKKPQKEKPMANMIPESLNMRINPFLHDDYLAQTKELEKEANSPLKEILYTNKEDDEELIELEELKLEDNPFDQTNVNTITMGKGDWNDPYVNINHANPKWNYFDSTKVELFQIIDNWKPSKNREIVRVPMSHDKGGRFCGDKFVDKRFKRLIKELAKELGKKVMSGSFNVAKIKVPIRGSVPKSVLECCLISASYFPLYMNLAGNQSNPVERMKFVATGILSGLHLTTSYMKPITPLVGETMCGKYIDGSRAFAEHITESPDISYFSIFGPNDSFKYFGFYDTVVKASINGANFSNRGHKKLIFKDGSEIKFNYLQEIYNGTVFGTIRNETIGTLTITDSKNDVMGEIIIGKIKKKPSDWFTGEIRKNSQVVSKLSGSYLSHIDVDGEIYWNFQEGRPFKLMYDTQNMLPSDHTIREDRKFLEFGDLNSAEKASVDIDALAKKDAKLRKENKIALEKDRKKNKK